MAAPFRATAPREARVRKSTDRRATLRRRRRLRQPHNTFGSTIASANVAVTLTMSNFYRVRYAAPVRAADVFRLKMNFVSIGRGDETPFAEVAEGHVNDRRNQSEMGSDKRGSDPERRSCRWILQSHQRSPDLLFRAVKLGARLSHCKTRHISHCIHVCVGISV